MNIYKEIQSILMELLDREEGEITEESYLVRELGAESIDLLELAAALNVRFRIEVNEDDIFLQGMQHRLTAELPALSLGAAATRDRRRSPKRPRHQGEGPGELRGLAARKGAP